MADYEAIILGAGRAGIGLAVRLIAGDRDDLCILEQGEVPADVADEVAARDLRSFIRVQARAASAGWDARRQRWEIVIAGAQHLTCRCLVAAWGEAPALPEVTGLEGAAFAPGEAVALPGFPNLLLLSGPDATARADAVLAAMALLDAPGAIEAVAPAGAAFDAEQFARIPVPEVKSIYG